MTLVPILLYHSIADDPSPLVAPFSTPPAAFAEHLDLIAGRGLSTLTVSELLDALDARDAGRLERSVVITFDDGFADLRAAALPALAARDMRATLFAATGLLRGAGSPVAPQLAPYMLAWDDLPRLRDAGIEIGAHSHTHPHLDTLGRDRLRLEIERSRTLLEAALEAPVTTFAYPHGYSSARVRRAVHDAGFRGACAVKDAFSSTEDDRFALARLMLRAGTTSAEVAAWLDRRGAPPPPRRERLRTRGWRAYRRGRAILSGRPGADQGWAALT